MRIVPLDFASFFVFIGSSSAQLAASCQRLGRNPDENSYLTVLEETPCFRMVAAALQDGSRGGPFEPAAYSWSGTSSSDQASSTGVTTRQDSSASSARIDRAELPVRMSRSSCA